MAEIDWFKVATAGSAFGAALLRAIPSLVTSGRARWRHEPTGAHAMLVQQYASPERWAKEFDDMLKTCADAATLRNRTLRFLFCASGVALLITAFYGFLAVQTGFGSWFFDVVAVSGAFASAFVVHALRDLWKDSGKRATAARARSAEITVSGDFRDVHQYALYTLRGLGARVVWVGTRRLPTAGGQVGHETQPDGQILATAGVFSGRFFIGELIEVNIESTVSRHKIRITSTKLDPVTLSRSNRYVAQFIEFWMFPPSRGLGHPDSTPDN